MQVRGHGVWYKALFDGRHSVAEPETPRPMADIENHSTGPCLGHDRIELAIRKNDGKLLGEHVRMNVTGPHLLQDEVDRKSTRLNSSHANISYAVFCLKKKKNMNNK